MQSTKEMITKLLPDAKVAKVQVDTRQCCWHIHLNCSTPPDKERLEEIKQYFYRVMPELKAVNFTITTKLTDQEIAQKLSEIWAKAISFVIKGVPSAKGWLQTARYNYREGTLAVQLKDKLGIKMLQQRDVVNQLAEQFATEIGFIPKIELSCDDNKDIDRQPSWQSKAEEEYVKKIQQAVTGSANTADKTSKKNNNAKSTPADTGVFIGRAIKEQAVKLENIQEEERQVVVCGRVFGVDLKELRSGRQLLMFNITDNTDSIAVKCFLEKDKSEGAAKIKNGSWVLVRGPVQHDRYTQELTLMAYDINASSAPERVDEAKEKRVELHLHTKMSAMDAVLDATTAITQAARWGHPAVAITDHGVIQAFPEAYSAGEKAGIKVIYGVEAYLIDDGAPVVENPTATDLANTEFVVFDIETTGLHPRTDEIIEIGALKFSGFEVVDSFSTLIRPKATIPLEIVKLTGITADMVKDAPDAAAALEKFLGFIGDAVLVAHNAAFDVPFIRVNLKKLLGKSLNNPVLDTLTLSRALYPSLKNHKLKTLCAEFKVPLENHHRAVDDAGATGKLLKIFLDKCIDQGIKRLADLNTLIGSGNLDKVKPNHVTILAQSQKGLENLYNLISLSHLKYFYRHPRIPKSLLASYREGLLIGSACEAGELFRSILAGAPEDKIEKIASFYDYLEIQPVGNSEFLVNTGQLQSIDQLREIYRYIYRLGKRLGKPVVATGDVHFLNAEDEIYRRILMYGQGFEDAEKQPPLYFKTTNEMLDEFSYLGKEASYEVVVTNPREIADSVDKLLPVPLEPYPPKIEGAEQQITNMAEQGAQELYGNPLPAIVKERLDKELKSIIGNGFAVLYLIAHKLVKKSMDDGYLVGSRGSVGSSLVATLTGITEVNPLPPHYRCPRCKFSRFVEDGSYGSGADMPDEECPNCGSVLKKDGHDIPFEVFMGFEGDKVPDIDLNFSGEYQPRAHKYTEELFGKDKVFRAGTIGTIAEKTAYGFVKKYLDEKKLVKREAEINRLVNGCTGVKRTTGQHPGGMMVVPKDIDVHKITPLQHPADDKKSGIITTHFDYHSIHDCLIKLDILGHDDPTVIKMLEDLTGVKAQEIPLDDPETLSLFYSTHALGVTPEQIRSQVGSYAIPEFGTKFVRQMLVDTKPKTFSELVRISGFSHGTDVWLNNAQDLIKEGVCQLSEAISARDDIMVYLIYQGLPPKQAFKIMEKVRKGRGVDEEDAESMRSHGVPQWYIESCRKIKYMFPKAHAVAYVMMAFRIAWFKVNYPKEFYATYFTVRADDFDADHIIGGQQAVLKAIEEIEAKGVTASTKEKNMLTILEVALEMYARGINFQRVDLKRSHSTKFLIVGEELLPPLMALQGLGESAAKSIVKAREESPFTSIEDLRNRAKVSKTVIEIMENHGCLQGMDQTDQLSLF
ncbi:PolC-type DNA polymerase III [Desulfofalx alkaliphila]|uniref:PolC-type DNA polymerase III n=1 Tax=Desulfofalx alkaliphila TaxID=105483 RepID=UPI000AD35BE5|nr:PolC-type DNA polymerase III [Desulfofalx alkaliphila]